MSSKKQRNGVFNERLRIILWQAVTWGQMEALAGITDRIAWWKGKTEAEASAELRRLIEDRLRAGVIE